MDELDEPFTTEEMDHIEEVNDEVFVLATQLR
jgi:hypothetical protein